MPQSRSEAPRSLVMSKYKEPDMRNWIQTIFLVNSKLDDMCDNIDKKVHMISLNRKMPAMKLFDKILDLNSRKISLVNLRVLRDKMIDSLTMTEWTALEAHFAGHTYEEIGFQIGFSRSSAFRIVNGVYDKLGKLLKRLGYGEERLMEEYGQFHVINKTYRRQCCIKPEKEPTEKSEIPFIDVANAEVGCFAHL